VEQLTKTEEAAGMNVPPAGQNHKMTLRRFVSVTFDNLRQLIQTMATPTTSLPVPVSITPPKANGVATQISQTPSAEPTSMETDTFGSNTLETSSVEADIAQELETVVVAAPAAMHAGVQEDEPAAVHHDSTDLVPAEEAPHAAVDVAVVNVPLVAALESLLFVADEAVEPAQLARALGMGAAEVEAGLQALDAVYREGARGLRLQTRNGRYQLVTAPEAANLIETFLNLDTTTKLSAPALETLAVAAYRQPVTRAQIEAVRGVDCSGVLRSLLQRGLLEEVGRLDAPGRPVLYGVTDLFMHHFGLTALHELPPLESTELARIEEATDRQA
jgi:segregation and condensation protein B